MIKGVKTRKPDHLKEAIVEGLVIALKAMNECYDMVRQAVKRRRKQKVVTVNISGVALKAQTFDKLLETEYVLTPVGDDFMIAPK